MSESSILEEEEEEERYSITGIVMGNRECEPADDLGNLYGIDYDPKTAMGNVTCIPAGSYVGPMNSTVYISGKYGKSVHHKDSDVLSVNSKGQVFMYHTLPDISKVSPLLVGSLGGAHVKIHGKGFDAYPDKTKVFIGSTECKIVDVNTNVVTCSAPDESLIAADNLGPRGLKYELWTKTDADPDTLDDMSLNHNAAQIDGSRIESAVFNETNGFTSRLSGYFLAPYTGKIAFYLTSSDAAKLLISSDTDPSKKNVIIEHSTAIDTIEVGKPHSDLVDIVQGEYYYIEAQLRHKEGNELDPKLAMSLWLTETTLHNSHSKWAADELWALYIEYERKLETQTFEFIDMPSSVVLKYTHAGMSGKSDIFVGGDNLEANILEMMTYSCTYMETFHEYKQDSEDSNYMLPGQLGNRYYFVEDVQPYCGKKVLENTVKLFSGKIELKKSPNLCFAAMGTGYSGDIHYKVEFTNFLGSSVTETVKVKVWEPMENEWKYQCSNLDADLRNSRLSSIANLIPFDSDIVVNDIIFDIDYSSGAYLDEITISANPVDISRVRPALPSDNVRLEKIENKQSSPGIYDLQFVPWTCPTLEEQFHLIGIKDADIEELDFDESNYSDPADLHAAKGAAQTEYLRTADVATFISDNWNGGKVKITRKLRGTRRLEGSYSLSRNNISVEITNLYPTPKELKTILESEFGLYGVNTYYWSENCWSYKIPIEFPIGVAGDIEDLQLDDSNIIVDRPETGFMYYASRIWHRQNGGMAVENPGPDYFRQTSKDPSLNVFVNGFLSSCSAQGCSLAYTEDLVASAQSVSSERDADNNEILIISGSGFVSDPDDYDIKVGKSSCIVISATDTEVKCKLPETERGTYRLTILIKSQGTVRQATTLEHTITMEIFDNNPKIGSLGGGTNIEIMGNGFPSDLSLWSSAQILIAGLSCKITSVSFTLVTCITDQSQNENAGQVEILIDTETATGGQFSYSATHTPKLTSLDRNHSQILGGDTLKIAGENLGMLWGKVIIGENTCLILKWNDTAISCITPKNNDGNYRINVFVPGNGFADNSLVPEISYIFKVTSMNPISGSIVGGTELTFTGEGFLNCEDIKISLDPGYSCSITTCNKTHVLCITDRSYETHVITNGGINSKYGVGYAWDQDNIVIQPGETVKWQWNFVSSSEKIGTTVHETNGIDNKYDGIGFKSGPKSVSGNFYHKFNFPGKHFYSSVPVNEDDIFMRGTIEVKENLQEALLDVMFSYKDVSAKYVKKGPSQNQAKSCIEEDHSCTDDHEVDDKLLFRTKQCKTPIVNQVSVEEGKIMHKNNSLEFLSNATLKFVGEGFSNIKCAHAIHVDSTVLCDTIVSTPNEIKCKMNPESYSKLTLKEYLLDIIVLGKGKAAFHLDKNNFGVAKIIPGIASISTREGGMAGGQALTVRGNGLNPYGGESSISIEFGEYPFVRACNVISYSSQNITCKVPDFSDLTTDTTMPVNIYLGYEQYHLTNSFPIDYTYKQSLTPSIQGVDILEIKSNSHEATITGSGFSVSSGNIKVYISREEAVDILSRKKRDIDDKDELHPFFKNQMGNEPTWKCGGSKARECAVNLSETEMVRVKRTVTESKEPKFYEEFCTSDAMISDCLQVLNIIANKKRSAERRRKRNVIQSFSQIKYEAQVILSSDNQLNVIYPAVPTGEYNLVVEVPGKGKAIGNSDFKINSLLSIISIAPSSGSVHGGQNITIIGNGFGSDTQVMVGDSSCMTQVITPGMMQCITTECNSDCSTSIVSSNSISTSSILYTMSLSETPAVTSIAFDEASSNNILVLSGTNFGDNPTVEIGSHVCPVSASTSTTATCNANKIPGGIYSVRVGNAKGYSNSDISITVQIEINDISPKTGSFGGGTLITLIGTGFSDQTIITFCGKVCVIQGASSTSYDCLTPKVESAESQKSCQISAAAGSLTVSSNIEYKYDKNLTPLIDEVNPKRGGTGGGTPIFITGTGFGDSGSKVKIDGVNCNIAEQNNTFIRCYTNEHQGSIKALIEVLVPGQGLADYIDENYAEFYYIDRWSSPWTWEGRGTPLEDEFIVVSEGQTILLDESTPKLKFLLIQGGTLIFDEEQPNIDLHSEFILLVGGGVLQVGTEEKPYESLASITLHGSVRCTELPIFGCKALGVRNGTLDLHGKHVPITWTYLSETVNPGDTMILLKQPVTWKAGDRIVIASTGDSGSMHQNEEHMIISVSEDGMQLQLSSPMTYKHISIEQSFGQHIVESRAEVGLLTRNIKFQGHKNFEFIEELPQCEDSFDAAMTSRLDNAMSCFSGKFGEEMGTDEMGAIIIISPKFKDQGLVTARIEYTEFNYVGQAFRVGRYPIHFHLPGNMSSSYVRGNAVHWSNNRAITLHDVSNLLVEKNVLFNIKGLSIFLEDGVETHNTLQYNLIIFTRMSTSLLNPDVTPGSFWIVNPKNKFLHNACAGSTHSCFWMRPNSIPDGPSFTRDYCPHKVGFGEFRNNTAHSMGQYGFWIFAVNTKVPYDPHDGDESQGFCNGSPSQAVIGSMTTWNCKRGFEIVHGTNIKVENQTHLDHTHAGFDIMMSGGPLGPSGPGIHNSVVVGHSQISVETKSSIHCTHMGVALPENGYMIDNVEFYNFDQPTCMSIFTSTSYGYPVLPIQTSNLAFINSPQKVGMMYGKDDEHCAWYQDSDGSLTGTPNTQLMSASGTHPSDKCAQAPAGLTIPKTGPIPSLDKGKWGHTGLVCDGDVKFHIFRILPYHLEPDTIMFTNMTLKNEYGESLRQYGITRKAWFGYLPQGTVNWFSFNGMEQVSNLSYVMTLQGLNTVGENYVHFGHKLYQQPDGVSLFKDKETAEALTVLPTYSNDKHGDWFIQSNNDGLTEVVILASDKEDVRAKRSNMVESYTGVDMNIGVKTLDVNIYKCQNSGCSSLPIPTVPPVTPVNALKWSSSEDWESIGLEKPGTGDIVIIPEGAWIMLDEDVSLKHIFIDGVLEVKPEMDIRLEVEVMVVRLGKFIVGYEDAPYSKKFVLVLKVSPSICLFNLK